MTAQRIRMGNSKIAGGNLESNTPFTMNTEKKKKKR